MSTPDPNKCICGKEHTVVICKHHCPICKQCFIDDCRSKGLIYVKVESTNKKSKFKPYTCRPCHQKKIEVVEVVEPILSEQIDALKRIRYALSRL